MMKKNVGNIDKIIRLVIVIGISYIAYSIEFENLWMIYALWIIAAILLLTVLTSWCPIFKIFGLNSCKVAK